jgi:hypothetical protein
LFVAFFVVAVATVSQVLSIQMSMVDDDLRKESEGIAESQCYGAFGLFFVVCAAYCVASGLDVRPCADPLGVILFCYARTLLLFGTFHTGQIIGALILLFPGKKWKTQDASPLWFPVFLNLALVLGAVNIEVSVRNDIFGGWV